MFAARELLKFVRAGRRHRFRDCAVLVRNLENYHQPLARVFRRYEIPFFLDRRENVAHHPLAELTRSALRTVAGDWRHDDWFAALKAGIHAAAGDGPGPAGKPGPGIRLARKKVARAAAGRRIAKACASAFFRRSRHFMPGLQRQKFEPTGAQLAEAVRKLWDGLRVETALEGWSRPTPGGGTGPAGALQQAGVDQTAFRRAGAVPGAPALHQTVFEQMNSWAGKRGHGLSARAAAAARLAASARRRTGRPHGRA